MLSKNTRNRLRPFLEKYFTNKPEAYLRDGTLKEEAIKMSIKQLKRAGMSVVNIKTLIIRECEVILPDEFYKEDK